MKKTVALILVGLMVVLSSCSKSTNSSETNPSTLTPPETNVEATESVKTIALVMKTLANPFFLEMEKGARRAGNELGINLIVKTGANETSIEEQITIVEELIISKVDAIAIAPGSSTELIPVLKKAQDAGIKIVNIDNRLDPKLSETVGLIGVPFISVDNEQGGYLCGKYLSDHITVPTDVAIIEGIRGADNAEQRKNGAIRAFKENSNINIVASETANWKIDEALTVITDIYINNPSIAAIFCANDMMALGVVEYMKENNKTGVLIGGYDNLPEAVTAIKAGTMTVTINQQADVQGYQGILFAHELILGNEVPLETLIEVMTVDASNLK